MFFKLSSAAVNGLDCVPIDIEVDINKGQTAFNIVGLADTSIQEAKERIHSALKNSGFSYPFNFRVLINLAPADLHKEGPSYDLPMAVGIIAVTNEFNWVLEDALIMGELALNGSLRHVNGVLPVAIFAKQRGFKRLFVPANDAVEATMVEGLEIYPVKNLAQLIAHLIGQEKIPPAVPHTAITTKKQDYELDMAQIKGQEFAKRALEITASGNHNILMSGPPGSGKTLLARTLPSILPGLNKEETLEVTKIYSVAGLLSGGLARERPFRSPHHTSSSPALVGGGRLARPGEISLAHRGVLFLDELPEFPRLVLESLRQPLEDGVITVSRAHQTLTYPARFILVASQNPCPCGYATDTDRPCVCSAAQILGYKKRVSGPLLDRIDLHVEVPRVKWEKLTSPDTAESSADIRNRVEEARTRQTTRFKNLPTHTNGEMGNKEIRSWCKLNDQSLELLRSAVTQLHLSARSYNRILKVARTIADLDKKDDIQLPHLAEALQFRAKTEL